MKGLVQKLLRLSDFLSMYSFCSVKVALDWRTFQVLCKQKKLI